MSSAQEQTVALTGVSGFIGRAVAARLLGKGLRVRALFRPGTAIPVELAAKVEVVVGDVTDPSVWSRLVGGAGALVHLASAGVSRAETATTLLDTNVRPVEAMLGAAKAAGCTRVVLAGSCFEYGATGDRIGERGLVEEDALAPVTTYGASKAAATLLLGALARDLGLEAFVLRPFHVYGPGEPATRLVPAVIRMAMKGEPIRVTHGMQERDLVFVDDVAEAFCMAASVSWPLALRANSSAVLNLCGGKATQLRQVVHATTDFMGVQRSRIAFGAVPARPNEVKRLIGDSTTALRQLGWSATTPLGEGLRRTVLALGGMPDRQ
ncbi:MAG: NAD(P)-dependent oxidoreductase [Anaeromyxobacter sp.]|nr:NAD(P)-dependent oxidoreductase [Anaeromyxobacter sp.]